MNHLTVQPAGFSIPKPTTWEMVMKNWRTGKDFKVQNGPYCSIQDLKLLRDLGIDYLLVIYQDEGDNFHVGRIWLGKHENCPNCEGTGFITVA